MTKKSASVKATGSSITKRFVKKGDSAFVKFIRELSIYQAATKLQLKFIPKLLSYNFKKRTITIEKIPGFDLGTIPESDYEEREKYLPLIDDILYKLKKYMGIYHNDILYRNFVFNPKKKRLYIIDFESSSVVRTSTKPKDYIEINISKLKKTKKKKKSKSKSNK